MQSQSCWRVQTGALQSQLSPHSYIFGSNLIQDRYVGVGGMDKSVMLLCMDLRSIPSTHVKARYRGYLYSVLGRRDQEDPWSWPSKRSRQIGEFSERDSYSMSTPGLCTQLAHTYTCTHTHTCIRMEAKLRSLAMVSILCVDTKFWREAFWRSKGKLYL